MIYVFGIFILLISLWFVRIKLKVEKNNRYDTTLIISNLFKIKIDLDELFSSKSNDLKSIINTFKIITNPFVRDVFSKSVVEVVKIDLFVEEEHPYLGFLGHMLLIELRSLCHKIFKKINKERFRVSFGRYELNGEIVISINLGKLVTIILRNYKNFKKLILAKN